MSPLKGVIGQTYADNTLYSIPPSQGSRMAAMNLINDDPIKLMEDNLIE